MSVAYSILVVYFPVVAHFHPAEDGPESQAVVSACGAVDGPDSHTGVDWTSDCGARGYHMKAEGVGDALTDA
jgi:hypothetical protein